VSVSERPVYGFMHVACMNHWREVVENQIWKIKESGLWKATSKIFWCVLGEPEDLLFDPVFMSKVEVFHRSLNLQEFEFPTIGKLDEVCRQEDCLAWYIHTKGVSYPDRRAETWRNLMEWFVLQNWKDCVKAMEDHDAAGAMYYAAHFKGNFWWTKSSHVRNLVTPGMLLHYGRDGGERWIMSLKRKYPFKIKNFWMIEWGVVDSIPPVPLHK
jgi:hypothetical protein